jgi:hypothetical protein
LDILNITEDFIDKNKIKINKKLIYSNYKINYVDKTIKYNCLYINSELLLLKFTELSLDEINDLLINNGSRLNTIINTNIHKYIDNTQYIITKNQWIKLMINLNNNKYSNFYYKFASYYPYIDFNIYYSLINKPNIKLISEIIYFDDVEREKFANSKLEYIIETFDSNIYNIQNNEYFDCEFSMTTPVKELMWYIQPKIFTDGLTKYGQNTSLIFDSNYYFTNNIITNQKLIFNNSDALFNYNIINNNYYTYLLSYKYLNNILPLGIYYYSFCLYPEDSQPSGVINLRCFKGKQYYIEFNKEFINEYNKFIQLLYPDNINNKNKFILKFISKNYNLISIHKGQISIIFTS